MLMSAQALINKTPKPTEKQVTEALAGHLCRCGTHQRIVQAIMTSVA
jgi:aerobic-type carbon monoxide dehydrogenase small subunit (CoxS/CutS family)